MNEFTIRRAKNGYIIKNAEDGEIVYQEDEEDGEEEELEAFANFLRELDFHYGPHTSKYTRQIRISIFPGDESNEKLNLEECPLCYSKLKPLGKVKQLKEDLSYLSSKDLKTLLKEIIGLQKEASNLINHPS